MEFKPGELVVFTLDDVLVEVVEIKEKGHTFLDLRRVSDGHHYPNVPVYFVERLKNEP